MPQLRRMVPRVAVLLTTLGMVAGNVVAVTLPLFGRSTAEVSARYPTLVVPAGYVFSVWGVIYVGMVAYSLAQFAPRFADDPLPDRLAMPLIIANVANVAWLFLWHALLIYYTVPVMLLLLGSLAMAYATARRDRPEKASIMERWAVRAPLGVYLGWVSVATIANISAALEAAGWDGGPLPTEVWAVALLAAAAVIAIGGLVREGDAILAAVIVWALVGVAAEQTVPMVVWIAQLLAAMVAFGILASAIGRRRLV